MKTINKLSIFLIISVLSFAAYAQTNTAQGVSIANTQTPPSKNAMLDVVSTEKGMLVPRVEFSEISVGGTLAPANVIAGEDGLLVFVKTPGSNYGYWYFDYPNTTWKKMGSSGGGTLIKTWNEMHDLVVTNNDRGMLVYVTDCEISCGNFTFDARGLYYYDGIGYITMSDQVTGCNAIKRWVRVTDGRVLSKCPNNSVACPDNGNQNECGDPVSNPE